MSPWDSFWGYGLGARNAPRLPQGGNSNRLFFKQNGSTHRRNPGDFGNMNTGSALLKALDNSYVSRMVNLTTLAPDIVAAILDETLPPEVTLFELASGTPLLWEEQRRRLIGTVKA